VPPPTPLRNVSQVGHTLTVTTDKNTTGPTKERGSHSPHGGAAQRDSQLAVDVCPHCSESVNLALIKGCLRCMKCGFKWDCNGW
jgi:hypothetical protein